MNSTHACLRRLTPTKCSPHPWGSAFGPPVRASKIVPYNFVEQRVKDAQARVNHLTHKMPGAFCSAYAPFGQMPRMASGASILAKAFANHIPVVCPTGQPAAVQNRSRRFCRGELTADWRAQNPDKNAGAHFCTASCCPQGEQQEAASELISGENSAAALLERIKTEREATAKPKRKAKS